ncbi:energy transducer TonB [Bradyrhizobium sp. USDA 4369]
MQRAKRYPAAAAAEHQTGTVQLNFTVSRNGRVLSRHIVRSSGSSALDQEVLAMIERAQPLPPFPPSMPQAQTVLTVPITFSR